MIHATLAPDAQLRLPWRREFNALAYVLNGNGTVGAGHRQIQSGQLALFGPGEAITMSADVTQESRSPSMDVLILGGKPIGETVAWMGPFVMNTHAELAQAYDDFQSGKLGSIPADWRPPQ
jgi:redox-sensitive bicupin YhaK (pirin superfamily)